MEHARLRRFTLERPWVVPGISRREVIKVTGSSMKRLTNQIALRPWQLSSAVCGHKFFSGVYLQIATDNILEQESLRRLRIAPFIRAVAVNHGQKSFILLDLQWHPWRMLGERIAQQPGRILFIHLVQPGRLQDHCEIL